MKDLVFELRSLIHSKYPSESKCAEALNWTRQRLNRITTGEKMPDVVELSELAALLGVSLQSLASVFVARKVNKRMTSSAREILSESIYLADPSATNLTHGS